MVNRLTAKWYAPQTSCTSPTVSYTYSGTSCLSQASCFNVGRRTGMTDQAGSESWAYDAMGRVEAQSRTTAGITKTTSYTYNLDSSIATMTYPSGRVVTYTPDTAGRGTALKDNTSGVYYVTGSCANGVSGNGTCYAPQSALSLIQNGSALYTTHVYNNRLQPCWMYTTTGTALATSHLCADTATTGNMLDLKYNFNLGADNGNPVSITNNRVTDRSQSFTYDQLNRISTAQTTATHSSDPTDCWGQAFGFDTWGNLLSISGASSSYTGCMQGSLSVTVTANNQISGDTYDAAGNLMTVPGTGGATYVYNSENQMTSTSNSSTQYVYDGDGNRVEKTGSKIYWYAGGEILDETDTTGNVSNSNFNEYYFFGGMRIARRDSSSNVFYYLVDHLDSSRVIAEVPSGQTTATLCYDADFEPYGGEHAYTNTCPQNYKFTSKERDGESGLDNFGARFYASTTGRFMSPDWALRPAAVPYATFGDPQTLNLYTYVENSPLDRIDADGHCSDVREGGCDGTAMPGGTSPAQSAQNSGAQNASAQPSTGSQNADNCPASACVTASAPKSFWRKIGGWFGGLAIGIVRWGRLGGPAHRAAVEALSKYWQGQGYKVTNEHYIRTRGGAKSYRFADVYGTKTNPDGTQSVRIGQIGRTNADGKIPVAREQSALNDIQAAEPNASVEFYDYQAPFPSETGIPGWPVQTVPLGIPGVGEGEAEPVDPEIVP